MDTISLTQKLVSIPSYVDGQNNEKSLGNFLVDYLKTIVGLSKIVKQTVDQKTGRFNVYAGNPTPELLIVGHIDTVQPQSGWFSNPFKPITRGNRIYGLGTSDMKGSVASFLIALEKVATRINLNKLGLLFYADEEYDFLGMKRFIVKSSSLTPRLVISLDGDLEMASGCRGCIELNLQFQGKSGHSSKPYLGTNAIATVSKLVDIVSIRLAKYSDKYLGPTTTNLAYLQGSSVSKINDKTVWRREGNIIPDYVDCTIEVRPSVDSVDKTFVEKVIKEIAISLELQVSDCQARHDLGPWLTSYDSKELTTIRKIYEILDIPFSLKGRMFSGYQDMQMLTKIVKAPMFIIGAGGENSHAPNEFVLVSNLLKAQRVFEGILLKYCS
jgi:acetylornithine deacetylase/succinyl-diaminopimelate desuccinylase-like protein